MAAQAQPLRLRAEAVAESRAPAGLVVLSGDDKLRPWLDAEGLVWAGAKVGDAAADILSLSARLHDPRGRGELRVGRFLLATGAVRPTLLDGAKALGRTRFGTTLELFGGAPSVTAGGRMPFDWLAGGRASQTVTRFSTVGVSYVQRRSHMEIADEEFGMDVASIPARWLDFAGRGAYDLSNPGIALASASVALRSRALRFEGFATHRSPSRMLPATSLFSVLGDFPSETLGATVKWNAAPRLDVLVSGAGQAVGGALGGNGWVRALLRTDDRGDGSVGIEVRRVDVSTARWTGVRVVGAQPLGSRVRAWCELELVVPDESAARHTVWPWGLAALSVRPAPSWEAAAAVEAGMTADKRYDLHALARVSRTWDLR